MLRILTVEKNFLKLLLNIEKELFGKKFILKSYLGNHLASVAGGHGFCLGQSGLHRTGSYRISFHVQ
jgi:hypothetical protein